MFHFHCTNPCRNKQIPKIQGMVWCKLHLEIAPHRSTQHFEMWYHLVVGIYLLRKLTCTATCAFLLAYASIFGTSIVARARLGPRASIFAVGPNQVRRTHAVASFTKTSIAYCTLLKATLTTATQCEKNANQSGSSKVSCDATCHLMR
jgi:hypothetical protein